MCFNEDDIRYVSRNNLTKRQKNLCNDDLAINRKLVTCALAAYKSSVAGSLKCIEGVGICGINGMLWEKYFGEDIDVTINGFHEDDAKVIKQNVHSNGMKARVISEDPCIVLRKESYDFIFLNCKTNTSHYLDSLFSKIKDNAIFALSTQEDPSLYWQTPDIALRNYCGKIFKTSYHREVAIRLVIAEMARACARYGKGFKILFTVGYRPQQAFTIIGKIKKGLKEARECIESIKKLAHCIICENRKFILNSNFLDKVNYKLDCDCSNHNTGKIVIAIGPLWTDEIFDVEFIELMIKKLQELNCEKQTYLLLKLISEEARCFQKKKIKPSENKKQKLSDYNEAFDTNSAPYFYFNMHRHYPKKSRLPKTGRIISLLQNNGFCASRTHFDSEAIRTNATLSECIHVLKSSS